MNLAKVLDLPKWHLDVVYIENLIIPMSIISNTGLILYQVVTDLFQFDLDLVLDAIFT